MKRLVSSIVTLLVSLSLTLSPSAYAVTNASAAGAPQANNSVESQDVTRALSGVTFAGQPISWLRVMNIARDPVVAWGPVHDGQGNVLQGELWLIVMRNDKFIYFQLIDTPNTAQTTTAYGGFTVKVKAPMLVQFHGVGSGNAVPLIGNSTDTFLVTTTEILVNSLFVEGALQKIDIRTGAEVPYLVHQYNEVRSYGLDSLGSRIALAVQYFSPDGVELAAPFQQTYSRTATSSYSAACTDAGNTASDSVRAFADTGEWVGDIGHYAIAFTLPIRQLTGVFGGSIQETYYQGTNLVASIGGIAGRELARSIVAPMAGALAEGMCEALTSPDVLPPIEVGFASPDLESSLVEVRLVCDAVESVYVGSNGSVDSNGNVTVIGHTEPVCTEWHHEIKS